MQQDGDIPGDIPDPRDAQILRLKADNRARSERFAEATDFPAHAIARLAAQHEEITRLPRRNGVIGPADEAPRTKTQVPQADPTRTNRIEPTMTWSIPRITIGAERRLLESMLDRNRAELINTVRDLSETEARRRLVASLTTPIGLLKHAAVAERIWFQHVLGGLSESECDGGATPGDASFMVDDNETLADVIAEFERASGRSRAIAADFDLDEARTHPRIGEVNLRFIYLLAIEDFARHAGHGDVLREQINHPAADVPEQP